MTPKAVYTTGEAAKIAKVSQQTIIRCFDNGDLKGFRVPGSRFRRIPHDNLVSFCRKYDIPLDELETAEDVLAWLSEDLKELLANALGERLSVLAGDSSMELGIECRRLEPKFVLIDVKGRTAAELQTIAEGLARHQGEVPATLLLVSAGKKVPAAIEALELELFRSLKNGAEALIRRIDRG